MNRISFRHALAAALAAMAALTTGCGGGGTGSDAAATNQAAGPSSIAAVGTAAPATSMQMHSLGGSTASTAATLAAVGAAAPTTPTLTVRARGTLAGNIGPIMSVLVDGVSAGSQEVRSTDMASYVFQAPGLHSGSKVEVVFANDAQVNGQDRNLYVGYVADTSTTVAPWAAGVVFDKGAGAAAFDGLDTIPGQGEIYWNGALRMTWPSAAGADPALASKNAASRFLQQATFGPTQGAINQLASMSYSDWLTQQMAMPFTPDFVNYIQSKYNLGDAYRPKGSKYNAAWVNQRFWATAANSPDQLRKRVAFALQHIFMISLTDSNVWPQARAYASYLDTLNKRAFGNFRDLLDDVALSPAMGIYLSHMRNLKEDPTTGRLPDENFAREVMQLFTIGLHELNIDGTPKLGGDGQPIPTYTNDDVMAMAKVFTGWSWAFPDSQLTDLNFRSGSPDYSAANDKRIDLLKMKAYPGEWSTAQKPLFTGKPSAVVIPENTSAVDSVRIALDTLFKHPNVGPFIGRQLIQQLVTSNPSPAYVARVAAVFNNNGAGVRGDLGAVVRAVLLDSEARAEPAADFGKLREPVLRVSHWMHAFAATSASGEYMMAYEMDPVFERPMYAPSVFGDFRPGYVPPNTVFSGTGATAPEFQIVNESTSASWVNLVEYLASNGLGWNGTVRDVSTSLSAQVALCTQGNIDGLLDNLNLLLFAGRMSSTLRADILDGVTSVSGTTAASQLNRARIAVYLAMSSPEYLVQR